MSTISKTFQGCVHVLSMGSDFFDCLFQVFNPVKFSRCYLFELREVREDFRSSLHEHSYTADLPVSASVPITINSLTQSAFHSYVFIMKLTVK